MVLWAFSNLVVQSEAQAFYDWISKPVEFEQEAGLA